MDTSFFARYRNPLVLLALVLLQTLGLAMQVPQRSAEIGTMHDPQRVTLLRSWTAALFTPSEHILQGSGSWVRHVWTSYVYLRGARAENEQLHAEIARLRLEQAAFAEDAAQGRRLEALLNFKQKYVARTVAAQVIGASGSDRSHVLWIDKGSKDGLQPDQPVITPDGVVGKLRVVQAHTAQLLLIDDPASGAGVLLASTRLRGIIRGTAAGEVQINTLTPDDRIKPGEQVITSGGDEVFPRGLPVGMIAKIVPDPQHQPYTAITIKPAANLRQLEEVLVITGMQNGLPPEAQADMATAEQIAEDNKRAADLVAERLPSLHEKDSTDNPAAADGKDAAIDPATGKPKEPAAPKVKPALHEDHFSPGAAPPAAELQPGAPVSSAPAKPQP